MTTKIAVIGQARFPADRAADIRPHLQAVVQASRENDGSLAYFIGEDVLEPGLFHITEIWPDAETFQRHGAAPHIAPYLQACRECGVLGKHFHIIEVAEIKSVSV